MLGGSTTGQHSTTTGRTIGPSPYAPTMSCTHIASDTQGSMSPASTSSLPSTSSLASSRGLLRTYAVTEPFYHFTFKALFSPRRTPYSFVTRCTVFSHLILYGAPSCGPPLEPVSVSTDSAIRILTWTSVRFCCAVCPQRGLNSSLPILSILLRSI